MSFIFNNLQKLFLIILKSNLTSCFGRNKTNGERVTCRSLPSSPLQKWTKTLFVPKYAQCSETYAKKNIFKYIFCMHAFKIILRINENPKKNIFFEKNWRHFFSFPWNLLERIKKCSEIIFLRCHEKILLAINNKKVARKNMLLQNGGY